VISDPTDFKREGVIVDSNKDVFTDRITQSELSGLGKRGHETSYYGSGSGTTRQSRVLVASFEPFTIEKYNSEVRAGFVRILQGLQTWFTWSERVRRALPAGGVWVSTSPVEEGLGILEDLGHFVVDITVSVMDPAPEHDLPSNLSNVLKANAPLSLANFTPAPQSYDIATCRKRGQITSVKSPTLISDRVLRDIQCENDDGVLTISGSVCPERLGTNQVSILSAHPLTFEGCESRNPSPGHYLVTPVPGRTSKFCVTTPQLEDDGRDLVLPTCGMMFLGISVARA